MSSARDAILARLAKGRREPLPVAEAYTAPPAGADMLSKFVRGLEKVMATNELITDASLLAESVEAYLLQHNAGRELVVTDAIRQASLLENCSLQLLDAPTRGNETSAITMAYAGIAETGSLVMLSGADTPVTTNFLPDNFVCVLKVGDVLNDMESLWARMASEKRIMPRSVNLVTGPSRTADVEQIIQMGAHGPRRVHVMLLDQK